MEGLRLLLQQREQHMLLVTSEAGELEGILTKTDILAALKLRSDSAGRPASPKRQLRSAEDGRE